MKRAILRRNKLFAAASPAEKRVLIAKDVIAQLKTDRLIAQRGIWTDMTARDSDIDGADSFQSTFLKNKNVACSCCAVGSLFIGCTLFANKIKNADIEDNFDLGDMLFEGHNFANGFNKLFSREQLGLIEIAFEGQTAFLDGDEVLGLKPITISKRKTEAARLFFAQNCNQISAGQSARAGLIKIMENIVANKGTFKP